MVTKIATIKGINYRNHIAWSIKQRVMMLLTTNQSQKDLAKTLGVLIGQSGGLSPTSSTPSPPPGATVTCEVTFYATTRPFLLICSSRYRRLILPLSATNSRTIPECYHSLRATSISLPKLTVRLTKFEFKQ